MRRLPRPRFFAAKAFAGFAAGAVALLGVSGCTSARPTYPVNYSFTAAIAYTLLHPGQPPVGANDWTCKPTSAHPDPVVLVHGTFADMTDSWEALSPLLANAGY